jgi:ribonuclease R
MGFPDKTVELPAEIGTDEQVAEFCGQQNARLDAWIEQQQKLAITAPQETRTRYDGTVRSGCRVFQEHPLSPFNVKYKFNTQRTCVSFLKLIEQTGGDLQFRNITVPLVQSWYVDWRAPEFEGDEDGGVVSADPSEELESHWFIEVFMVLANEQVAAFLEREHVPTVYRVHDLPDPFHVDHLLDILASLGLPTPPFDPMQATPKDVRRVTREIADWVDRYTPVGKGKAALVQQVLRAQSRAEYQTANIGHFGLASEAYCHFTSPIRRYPDILVHRGLLAHLGLGPTPTTSVLDEWAEHCSRTEREAAKVELKADDVVLAHLLKRRLDEEGWGESVFEGQILSLTRRGMFILFDRLFQGYLPISELPRDNYRLNDLETAIEGKRSLRAYKIADTLPVRVVAVDAVRGRVDLALAGEPLEGAERRKYGASGRRRVLTRMVRRG